MAKKKHAGGRPTDYSQEVLQQSKDYLVFFEKYGDEIPSVAGLSEYLSIARSTIYDWATHDDKKEFSDILEKILAKQEKTLLSKGLNGKFNSTITKLVLAKHGYTDKTDLTSNGETLKLSFDQTFKNDEPSNPTS